MQLSLKTAQVRMDYLCGIDRAEEAHKGNLEKGAAFEGRFMVH